MDPTPASEVISYISLSPFLQDLAGVVSAVLVALIGFVVRVVCKKLGVQVDAQLMQNLDDIAMKGIAHAAFANVQLIAAKGYDHPDVHSQVIAAAVNYVASSFVGAFAKAGVDPKTEAGRQAIANLVTRALPAGMEAVSSSPSMPPVPPDQKNGVTVVVTGGPTT